MVGDAFNKHLIATYSPFQILFLRSLGSLAVLLGFVLARGGIVKLRTQRPFAHAARVGVMLTAMILYNLALKYLMLAETVTLFFAGPLFITALSAPLLGERIGWRRWGAVAVGFAGVIVVMQPGTEAMHPAALLAVGAALFYAFVNITTRILSRTEASLALVLYSNVGICLGTGLAAPFQWIAPATGDVALLFALGAAVVVAQYFHVTAIRYAQVSLLAPFEYTAIFWAALIGFAVWGEVPAATVWLGIAIIVGSGLYILYWESVAARKP
ncbi:MAG: DMT family transporter [Rhodospirillales bacterium]|nr:DMT family transporter [Rhodospirillales bacterium]